MKTHSTRFSTTFSLIGGSALVSSLALLGCSPPRDFKLAAEKTGDLSNAPAERTFDQDPAVVQACGDGARTVEGEQTLDRTPYLQQVTESSAHVLFTSYESGGAFDVEIRLPGADETPMEVVSAEPDPADTIGNQREAVLQGLEADTVYCYRISGFTDWAGFTTAPTRDSGKTVRFVVLGDSGAGTAAQAALTEQMRTVQFDLFLHTGDIAYQSGTLSQLEAYFFDEYPDLINRANFAPVAGNHEYETRAAAPYLQVFSLPENGAPEGTERWYSFEWGDVHFVMLDTERMNDAQLSWLTKDLASNQRPWTIALLHKPPYSSGKYGSNGTVRSRVSPILERYRVPLVFAGHEHDYERTVKLNGVTYVVTGGGGHSSRPVGVSSFTAFSEDVIHFVYGEVTGSTLVLHAIDAVGREFDSLRLDLPAPSAG